MSDRVNYATTRNFAYIIGELISTNNDDYRIANNLKPAYSCLIFGQRSGTCVEPSSITRSKEPPMVDNIIWQIGATALSFEISPERPVAAFLTPHAEMSEVSPRQQQASMLEALSLEEGRSRTQTRYSTCKLTEDLRYVLHENDDTRETKVLRIVQESRTSGLRTTTAFETYRDTEAFRAQTTYSNCGPNPITLTAASTFVLAGVDQFLGNPNSTSIFSAYTEWGAESRWSVRPLLQDDSLVRINSALQPARTRLY